MGTKIEWCDATFNPWMGCTKVSPGCANCYAERDQDHHYHKVKWGAGNPRVRTSAANWKKPLAWNKEAQKTGERCLVFCASLADVFDKEVPESWRDDLYALINATPYLTWLLLTKREQDMHLGGYAPNVWLGVTAENQEMWDKRVPLLLSSGASKKFVSVEPMLGPIDMRGMKPNWLIVGGESGGNGRAMHYEWVSYLYAACDYNKVPFFFKQVGNDRSHWPLPCNFETIKEFPK